MPKVMPPELKKFMDKKLSSECKPATYGCLASRQPVALGQQQHPDPLCLMPPQSF
jgi:hypothetical protein